MLLLVSLYCSFILFISSLTVKYAAGKKDLPHYLLNCLISFSLYPRFSNLEHFGKLFIKKCPLKIDKDLIKFLTVFCCSKSFSW